MNTDLEAIRTKLKHLKLFALEKVIDRELARAEKDNLDPTRAMGRLLDIQLRAVTESRIERRIRESKLPERKLLADFDFEFQTGVDKNQILKLASLGFVELNQGVIFAGNSGTGKSHLAKALLLLACQKLHRCRYTTAAAMLSDLSAGLADDTLEEKLKAYTRPRILFIDELGFDRLEQESTRNASLFFKVIDARYGKNSTWLTTNIDFKALGDYLGDPVVTTAIVDRMVHHAIIIHIEGPSWRLHESKKLNQTPARSKTKGPKRSAP
jgi:DNA replication protein DnaC